MTTVTAAPGQPDRTTAAPPITEADWFDREGYPFTSHYLRLPKGRLHYVDEGSGPAVVLVHGTPGWSYDFRALISALRSRYRCIAVDHLGFGLSDRPARVDQPLQLHTRNLQRLLESLGVDRFALIAHDFGGPIALPLAIASPDRVHALCLLNTWAWSMNEDPAFSKTRRVAGSAVMRFLYRYLNFSARMMVKSSWGTRTPLTPIRHRHFTALFPNRASREGTWAFARCLVTGDATFDAIGARLNVLRDVPGFVVWGLADRFVGAPHLARWKRELPHARFLELDRVGHFPQDEAAADVVEGVRLFLDRYSA
jgi:pimeloyl-ACP methyl ester carboxylesterase